VFAARGHAREEARAWLARFEPFSVVRVAVPEDAWRVEWVATQPRHRGCGVIAALLEALLERGREEGCTEAHVATALENAGALRAYERAGFSRYAEWRHADYAAIAGSAGDVYLRRAL
jgi:GNAT superfamily N-acetyltransferase